MNSAALRAVARPLAAALCLAVAVPAGAQTGAQMGAQAKDPVLGRQLAECSALFGLTARSQSENARAFQAIIFVLATYGGQALGAPAFEQAVTEEVKRLPERFPPADRTKERVLQEVAGCVHALQVSEARYRDQLSELDKSLAPEHFGRDLAEVFGLPPLK